MIKKSPTKKSTAKKAPAKKKSVRSAPKKAKPAEPIVTILQTSKCQTVSGKSTLTYNVGIDDKDRIFLRVLSTTGGGHHGKEWILLENITSILSKLPTDQPITSLHLFPLFSGRSVNNPGFLLAVLLSEKILEPFEGKKRQYSYTGDKTFTDKVNKLKARKKKS